MARKKFYVTTPIYYPNDIPHVGHAYTTIVGDVIARGHKLKGEDVFYLTGTDEHGKKIETAAKKKTKNPKEFVDELVPEFKNAWKKLNIDYDRFIRTTEKDHEKVVLKILQKVFDKGDIYLGEYEGLYCTGCEAYYTERDLVDGCCPIHKTKAEKLKEKSYFFKLSKYKKKLLKLYKDNPNFILPKFRVKEIINRLEDLQDLSISRTSFNWGIKLPFDNKHISYVWFDALLNYLTGVGYLKDDKKFSKFWPADLHIVAKDIMWFHVVIWPTMLMSAGIKLPKTIFVHGYWTFNKKKISKSRGKVINVNELISITGNVDSIRYFLLRETPFGDDGDFSEQALIDRHNNELANKLGNLVSRVSGLIEKFGISKSAPKGVPLDMQDGVFGGKNKLLKKLNEAKIEKLFENYEFDKVLNEIFSFIDICNEYVQNKKPWETRDKKVLYELKESILKIADLLWPFIPESAEKIKKQFSATKIKKSEILFKKI
ncbi:methionine--tRNA ligase [Candidatus Pacearchaeota archaeon]|nr:methionine--tRNA ligase [Candidatus Pacearchaeota archaeon]